MPDVLKTLLMNPPSFENFDGGASSRWPATREIESYWYPVWLTYPAGLIPGSRLLDASPHKITWQQTVEICKNYEFLVLYTSTVGFYSDVKLLRKIKEANPSMKVAFVGPHGHIEGLGAWSVERSWIAASEQQDDGRRVIEAVLQRQQLFIEGLLVQLH